MSLTTRSTRSVPYVLGRVVTDVSRLDRDIVAEAVGFEPTMQFWPHTPLAGEPLQPLGHASLAASATKAEILSR